MAALRPTLLRARQLAAPLRQIGTTPYPRHGESNAKEESTGTMVDAEKRKHLKGETKSTIKDGHGWSEKLASDSEASIKAEKHHKDDTVEELQKHTVKTVREVHHEK